MDGVSQPDQIASTNQVVQTLTSFVQPDVNSATPTTTLTFTSATTSPAKVPDTRSSSSNSNDSTANTNKSSPLYEPPLFIDQYSNFNYDYDGEDFLHFSKSFKRSKGSSSSVILLSSVEDTRSGQSMELSAIHPVVQSFLIGSVSGTCSTVIFQPLDLLKTRLQTPDIRHAGTGTHPAGMFSVFGHILRDEKLVGLWRGMTPSLTRCVPGVGLYFATIHGLKNTFNIKEPSALESVLLGVTGRTLSGVVMIPFTVVKTRFESRVYQYRGIGEALGSIYSKEGLRGLTCGLLPTLLRDAPFSGIYLMMYTWNKKALGPEWMESPTAGPYLRFSCGILAGIGASLVTQPADVLKTKMQLYPDKFQSIRPVVIYVYQKYGIQGYFKGLMPRMIRRSLIAAMSWTLYEQLIQSMGLK